MLPSKYRLDRQRLPSVKSGTKISSPLLSLIFLPNQVGHLRVAVIIGKKVSPLATVRNHTKRQLFSAVKPHLLNFSEDIILLPRPPITTTTYQTITNQVDQLIHETTHQHH